MTDSLKNFVSMAGAVLKVCHKNEAITTAVPAFKVSVEEADIKLAAISSLVQADHQSSKFITDQKRMARIDVGNAATEIAQCIVKYAYDSYQFDLLNKAYISQTRFFKGGDVKIAVTCKFILELAEKNAHALIAYGITPMHTIGLKAFIQDFEKLILDSRMLLASRRNSFNHAQLQARDLSNILKFKLDGGIKLFKTLSPSFYNDFNETRMIVNVKVPITGVKGIAVDKQSKVKLQDVKVVLVEVGAGSSTTKRGIYTFMKLAPGSYTLKAIADGYEELVLEKVNVTEGRIIDLHLQLTRKAA